MGFPKRPINDLLPPGLLILSVSESVKNYRHDCFTLLDKNVNGMMVCKPCGNVQLNTQKILSANVHSLFKRLNAVPGNFSITVSKRPFHTLIAEGRIVLSSVTVLALAIVDMKAMHKFTLYCFNICT